MFRLIKITAVLLVASVIGLPLLLLLAISDNDAIGKTSATVDSQTAARLKSILNQLEYASYFKHQQRLLITEEDMNGALALANRATQRIQGTVQIRATTGTTLSLSLHTPENPFGQFINIRLRLPARSNGVNINQIQIGRLSLNDKAAQRLLELGLDQLFGKQQSQQLMNAVISIRSDDQRLLLSYQPIPNLAKLLARGLNNSGLLGNNNSLAKATAIQRHYQELCRQYHDSHNDKLASYLALLFTDAAQRSDDSQQAVMENRAAIAALAIFFGSYKFNTLLNAVPAEEIERCQKAPPQSLLAGRQDLSLHFIYSAMIKVMSDSGVSFAMGEFKELGDALRGGSGFSFVDLAADRAGIRFAELATSQEYAIRLQQLSSSLLQEANFFPSLHDLPEAISEQAFEQNFGGVEGERYKQLLGVINSRIEQLALYSN